MTSSPTDWRAALAAEVAAVYADCPRVGAVLLAGSVARGWADPFSDIELFVFWHESPSPSLRQRLIARAGGFVDLNWAQRAPTQAALRRELQRKKGRLSQLWPYEDNEWSEHFFVNGVEIGVSGFLAPTVEQLLDGLLLDYDPAPLGQMLASSLTAGRCLVGTELVEPWRARVKHYPEGLSRAVIDAELSYEPLWAAREYAVARGELILLLQIKQRLTTKLLRLLFGLNRRYLPDPRFKWLAQIAPALPLCPPQLVRRLQVLSTASPANAMMELRRLMEQSLDLIDHHLPGLDTDFARDWLTYRRARWDEPPPVK
ncbi:MAG: nucleotidyltransferase domain-containing protein [Candidatus Promineifilaceae bacterium]|nr:nucleotidyltransferase domain-containing protein [Candidatus Promineifilaceae bacterium]